MTTPGPITPTTLATLSGQLAERRPLVHNLTNAVVANFVANALLAVGAAPVMAEGADEAAEVAASADAVVINLGMLSPERGAIMHRAALSAKAAGKPWVLDPVGAGAITTRTRFAQELCRLQPTAIRGNASEVLALAGEAGGGRGVDSGAESQAAVAAARNLASAAGSVVAITGKVDNVTDGAHVITLHNGHELMTRVTGMGCAATAIIGACLALGGNVLSGVAHALAMTGIAGEMAAQGARGPGSMMVAFLDAMASLDHARLRVDR